MIFNSTLYTMSGQFTVYPLKYTHTHIQTYNHRQIPTHMLPACTYTNSRYLLSETFRLQHSLCSMFNAGVYTMSDTFTVYPRVYTYTPHMVFVGDMLTISYSPCGIFLCWHVCAELYIVYIHTYRHQLIYTYTPQMVFVGDISTPS